MIRGKQMVSYVDILYLEEICHISLFKTLRFMQHIPPLFLTYEAHASGFGALSPTPWAFEYSLYLKMWLLLFLIQIICKGNCWISFITFIGLIMLVGQEIHVFVHRNFFCIIINIIVWDTSNLSEFFQRMLGDLQHFQLIFNSYFGHANKKWCPCCHCKIIPNVMWKYNRFNLYYNKHKG